MVAPRRDLPGLRPQLRRQRRRRRRRPARDHLAAALPARPRGRRALDHAVLHLAAARPRLRRGRLRGRRPAVRHPGRRGRAGRHGASAGAAGRCRPRAQPHLERARVVPGRARQRARLAGAGALPVPRRQGSERRRAAQQLALGLRRPGLDPGARRSVVPPPLRRLPAGPRLAQPRGRRPVRGGPEVLAGPWCRRLPGRRGARAGQGGEPARPGRRGGRGALERRGQRGRGRHGRARSARRADVGPARAARRLPALAPGAGGVPRRPDDRGRSLDPGRGVDGPVRQIRRDEPGVQLLLAARAVVGARLRRRHSHARWSSCPRSLLRRRGC